MDIKKTALAEWPQSEDTSHLSVYVRLSDGKLCIETHDIDCVKVFQFSERETREIATALKYILEACSVER